MNIIPNKQMFFIQKNLINNSYLAWNPDNDLGFSLGEFSQWEGIQNYTRLAIANWVNIPLSKGMGRIEFREVFWENANNGVFAIIDNGNVDYPSHSICQWMEQILWWHVNDIPQQIQFIKLDDSPLNLPLSEGELIELRLSL